MKRETIEEVVRQMRAFVPTIDLPVDFEEEVKTALTFLRCDYPSTFHVGEIRYSYDLRGKKAILRPKYLYSESDYNALISQILSVIGRHKKALLALQTEEEKELYVHDLLCRKVKYADDGPESHSIVGPLLRSRGVCDGISKSAQELFHVAGVRSHVIAGEARNGQIPSYEPHAWNIVRIGGKWRHIDVTFDNTLSDGTIRYDYVDLSTNAIKTDHRIRSEYRAFAAHCTDEEDWFVRQGLSFGSTQQAFDYIVKCLKNRKERIYFRLVQPANEASKAQLVDCFKINIGKLYSSYQSSFTHNAARNVFFWEVSFSDPARQTAGTVIGKLLGINVYE